MNRFLLPTTLPVDRDGRELGRLAGSAKWDELDMTVFFRKAIAQQTGALPAQQRKERYS